MDRHKCQRGMDKVFDSEEIDVRGENWRRGRRSITAFDGVADWCCRANAELLRKWSVMDGSFAG